MDCIVPPVFGVSPIWRHSESEKPWTHLLLVRRLWNRPKQHTWASRLHLFWTLGEWHLSIYLWLLRVTLKQSTFHVYTLLHQIADGQRELIRSHSVKNRHFIGNTSMDAGLSFIMANHAKVKENDLVFDPFVGTGKLLYYWIGYLHAVANLCQ